LSNTGQGFESGARPAEPRAGAAVCNTDRAGQTVLLATGFAAAITESISMGAVGWTSAQSERDYYAAEHARESADIDATPEAERQEIRDIYARKGFTGELLERVVDTITANRDAWLDSPSAACSTPPGPDATMLCLEQSRLAQQDCREPSPAGFRARALTGCALSRSAVPTVPLAGCPTHSR